MLPQRGHLSSSDGTGPLRDSRHMPAAFRNRWLQIPMEDGQRAASALDYSTSKLRDRQRCQAASPAAHGPLLVPNTIPVLWRASYPSAHPKCLYSHTKGHTKGHSSLHTGAISDVLQLPGKSISFLDTTYSVSYLSDPIICPKPLLWEFVPRLLRCD